MFDGELGSNGRPERFAEVHEAAGDPRQAESDSSRAPRAHRASVPLRSAIPDSLQSRDSRTAGLPACTRERIGERRPKRAITGVAIEHDHGEIAACSMRLTNHPFSVKSVGVSETTPPSTPPRPIRCRVGYGSRWKVDEPPLLASTRVRRRATVRNTTRR